MKQICFRAAVILLLLGLTQITMEAVAQTAGLEQSLQEHLYRLNTTADQAEIDEAASAVKQSMLAGGYQVLPNLDALVGGDPARLHALETIGLGFLDPTATDRLMQPVDGLAVKGRFSEATGHIMYTASSVSQDPLTVIAGLFKVTNRMVTVTFLLFFLLGIFAMAQYGRNLVHDLKHLLSMRIRNPHLVIAIVVLICVLPVALTIHVKYLPIYWLLLLVPYMAVSVKKALLGSAIICSVLIAIAAYLSTVGAQVSSPDFMYYRSMQMPFAMVEGFQPAPDLELFAKATNRLRQGAYTDAINFYKEVNPSSFLYAYALNNIGVAYFHLREFELARDFIRESVELGDSLKGGQYNLAAIQLNTFNLAESDTALTNAFLDQPDQTLTSVLTQLKQTMPLVIVPDVGRLYRDLFALNFSEDWSWSKTTGTAEFMFMLILFAVGLGILFVFRERDISDSCTRCGKPYRFLESHNESLCKQCVTVFVKKDNLDSARRMAKVQSIRKYNKISRLVQMIIGIAFPGLYPVFVSGHFLKGIFTYHLFFGCLFVGLMGLDGLGSWLLVAPLFMISLAAFVLNMMHILQDTQEE